jgi:hypothetical protein
MAVEVDLILVQADSALLVAAVWKNRLLCSRAVGSNVLAVFFLGGGGVNPQWDRASSFTKFLDHTQRRSTVGRTPLDE